MVWYWENYQDDLLAVLDHGLQMEMDVNKPGNTMVIEHVIGYAVSMGMGLLLEIGALRTSVSISTTSNYIMGLTTLVIVACFCY